VKAIRVRRAKPWLALSATVLAGSLSSSSPAWQSGFALTPDAVARLELWRLWTGHLVHFGPAHLRGDVLAFFVWAALLEAESRALLWRVLLGVTPLLSVTILLCCPTLAQYRGLSGLDCSLVVALMALRARGNPKLRALCGLCLSGFAAKCGYELLTGRALLAPDLGAGVALLPLAHVLGAALGLLAIADRLSSATEQGEMMPSQQGRCSR
jgi:rhomboid family GlyGly-CTERM serine protease